jgi:hypothetical protein
VDPLWLWATAGAVPAAIATAKSRMEISCCKVVPHIGIRFGKYGHTRRFGKEAGPGRVSPKMSGDRGVLDMVLQVRVLLLGKNLAHP